MLFLRNLLLARATSPGFDVRNTLRAEVHLPPVRYRDEALQKAYFSEALRNWRPFLVSKLRLPLASFHSPKNRMSAST